MFDNEYMIVRVIVILNVVTNRSIEYRRGVLFLEDNLINGIMPWMQAHLKGILFLMVW